eukprot:COSAG01_NODE_49142_length_374_cov_5.574545_2_plen_55_part_01
MNEVLLRSLLLLAAGSGCRPARKGDGPKLAIYPSFRPVHDLHRQPMGCGHYTAIA